MSTNQPVEAKNSTTARQAASPKEILGWIIAILVPVVILLVPATESFTAPIKTTIAITTGIMIAFGFELLHNTILAIILLLLYVLTGVGSMATAFSGYSNPVVWACPAAMLLVGCLHQTKILKKFSYTCMLKAGGNNLGILAGVTVFSYILGAVLGPDLCIPMILILYALCVAVGIPARSNTAACLMLGAYLASNAPTYLYYNTNIALCVGAAQTVNQGVSLTYTEYLYHNWPMAIFGILSVAVPLVLLRRDNSVAAKDYLDVECRKIGRFTAKDKLMAAILVLLLIGLLTMSKTGLNIAWVLLIASVLCFLPGIRIGNQEAIQSVNWNVFIFMGATMGTGSVFAAVGASDFIASMMAPMISNMGKIGATFLIWLIGVVANFFLTPLAAMSSLIAPLVSIGETVGLDPIPIIYAFRNGVSQCLLPYEIAPTLLLFSYGMVSLKQFVKVMGTVLVLNGVFIMLVMVPYWTLIGLM